MKGSNGNYTPAIILASEPTLAPAGSNFLYDVLTDGRYKRFAGRRLKRTRVELEEALLTHQHEGIG